MNSELNRILKMIEEGVINAEEGSKLIAVLQSTESEATEERKSDSAGTAGNLDGFNREDFMKNDMKGASGERFLQVRVLSADGDKVKVNLPINFVKGILKVTGKLPMIHAEQLEGVDVPELMETISAAIESDLTGRLVDVETTKGDMVVVEIV